jgi:hypothetical protein
MCSAVRPKTTEAHLFTDTRRAEVQLRFHPDKFGCLLHSELTNEGEET